VTVSRDFGGRKYEVVLTQVIFDAAFQGKGTAAVKPTAETTTASGSGS